MKKRMCWSLQRARITCMTLMRCHRVQGGCAPAAPHESPSGVTEAPDELFTVLWLGHGEPSARA